MRLKQKRMRIKQKSMRSQVNLFDKRGKNLILFNW